MKLFVGLGNPGAKYAGNRHNIGFMALDRIAGDHGFGPWRKAHQGMVAEGRLGDEKVCLLKPGTFMNLSGQSVGEAMRFFRLTPQDVTVFHDELDLGPGRLRLKQGGGHAGHNGLRSIHDHIGERFRRGCHAGGGGRAGFSEPGRPAHGPAAPARRAGACPCRCSAPRCGPARRGGSRFCAAPAGRTVPARLNLRR